VETGAPRRFTFKVVFLGDAAVGKTSIVARHVTSCFNQDIAPSLGANLTSRDYNVAGQPVTLLIWDIAAQEAFSRVRQQYYNGAKALFLVYDVTRPGTFEDVMVWLDDFNKTVKRRVPTVLVGNKVDLPAAVPSASGEKLAHDIGASFVETSAKTGQNVEDLFEKIVSLLVKQSFP
jgi:small GTP-binding protein